MPLSREATSLIQEITAAARYAAWEIDLPADCRELQRESYFRFAYRNGFYAVDPIHAGNLAILLAYLMASNQQEMLQELRRSGFFSFPEQESHFHDFLFSAGLSAIQNLSIDTEELELALMGCSDPEAGLEFYIACNLNLDSEIKRLIGIYAGANACGAFAPEILYRNLKESHVYWQIHAALKSAFLVRLKKQSGMDRSLLHVSAEIQQALQQIGLAADRSYQLKDIQKAYRKEIMQCHPDRNPAGLEKTMALNQAYAILSIAYG